MSEYAFKIKTFLTRHQIYIFIIPAVFFYFIFKYKPLYFIQIAFREFRITRDIADSPWVGFEYFHALFSSPDFITALINTLIIGFYKIFFGFPLPIILALMLNELKNVTFMRLSQTIVYLPHFISWSVLGGIFYSILSVHNGMLNELLVWFGREPIFFMGSTDYFRAVLVGSDIWKSTGWGTILYLAALSRIDVTLYEAAYVDGASKMQRLFYITLPGIGSTIIVLFIINIGHFLDVGVEQILVMGNTMVLSVSDIIDTYVFRVGLQEGNHSLATAAGVFKTIVAAILIITCDRISKFMGSRGIL